MHSDSHIIVVEDLTILLQRKKIKNLNLAIIPPNGTIRLSVPMSTSEHEARRMILEKYHWIKKKCAVMMAKPKVQEKLILSGETFPYQGQPYELEVIEGSVKKGTVLIEENKLQLYTRPNSTTQQRKNILDNWYHLMLERIVPSLIAKWEPIIGKRVATWNIRKMKTQWGSCHIQKKHIQLNLDLITKPLVCLEYVIVHEMVHLYERYHNARFKAYMDQFMPQWRTIKKQLDQFSL